jgi:hypothetical protein
MGEEIGGRNGDKTVVGGHNIRRLRPSTNTSIALGKSVQSLRGRLSVSHWGVDGEGVEV